MEATASRLSPSSIVGDGGDGGGGGEGEGGGEGTPTGNGGGDGGGGDTVVGEVVGDTVVGETVLGGGGEGEGGENAFPITRLAVTGTNTMGQSQCAPLIRTERDTRIYEAPLYARWVGHVHVCDRQGRHLHGHSAGESIVL
jgi:hypothetical protein